MPHNNGGGGGCVLLAAAAVWVAVALLPSLAAASYVVTSSTTMPWGTEQSVEWQGEAPAAFATFGAPVSPLTVRVATGAADQVRMQITDPADPGRWQVPDIVAQPPWSAAADAPELATDGVVSAAHTVTLAAVGAPFAFTVTRAADGSTLFDTSDESAGPQLFFADQFIALSTSTSPQSHLAGLGERRFDFWLHAPNDPYREFSFFAADQGTPPEKGLYGSHPFYLDFRPGSGGSTASGAFLLNSNAMQVNLGATNVTYLTTGGIIDLFVFAGPTAQAVIQQYHGVIGRPAMPPYWSLGFHQCRWGYKALGDVKNVVDGFETAQIPLDTVWMDIDYMDDWKVFTVDPVNFPAPEFGSFVQGLLNTDRHFVPIVDPGVKIQDGYHVYAAGLEANAFIKFGPTGERGDAPTDFVVGKVWPKLVNYPDWTHPNTSTYWSSEISTFRDVVEFSGLWIDMNEPSSFCDGRCQLVPDTDPNLFGCDCPKEEVSSLNTPPFLPGGADARTCRVQSIADSGGGLDCGTLSMTTEQHGGLHYNLHNLFGHLESVATAAALRQVTGGQRPFVITRSTFPGTGAYVGHWLGDNDSTFDQLKSSISGMVTMNMFGIPLVGADICGFAGDTTEELCMRWMQMGSFYPFSRNHNVEHARSQEPFTMGQRLADVSRASLNLRYALLPFYATLFWRAHTDGGMVVQPSLFAFPDDEGSLASVDTQFMIGGSILVSPVLTAGATVVTAHFPPATWHNITTGEALPDCDTAAGCTTALDAPLDVINLHVRAGSIIPRQGDGDLTTAQARQQPFNLLVALAWTPADAGATPSAYGGVGPTLGGGDTALPRLAGGELYYDDGVTFETGEGYAHVVFAARKRTGGGDSFVITSQVLHAPSGPGAAPIANSTLGSIEVYGTACPVLEVTLTSDLTGGSTTQQLSFVQQNRLNTLRATLPAGVVGMDHPFHVSFLCATDVAISVWVWLAPLLVFVAFITFVVVCWCRKDIRVGGSASDSFRLLSEAAMAGVTGGARRASDPGLPPNGAPGGGLELSSVRGGGGRQVPASPPASAGTASQPGAGGPSSPAPHPTTSSDARV